MSELEDRFGKAIDDAKFTLAEVQGFMVKPRLALIAGIAIGYRLAITETAEAKKEIRA